MWCCLPDLITGGNDLLEKLLLFPTLVLLKLGPCPLGVGLGVTFFGKEIAKPKSITSNPEVHRAVACFE
jgi:hypothetical protein